ncbi:MAG: methylase [Bryobacterales bacterium]|nr:methylase [Bryobacterales bacterium]
MASHLDRTKCEADKAPALLDAFLRATATLRELITPFLDTVADRETIQNAQRDVDAVITLIQQDAKTFVGGAEALPTVSGKHTGETLRNATAAYAPIAGTSRDLGKQADHTFKLLSRLLDICEKELNAKEHDSWNTRDISRARKLYDDARHSLVEQLREIRYFQRQAAWLTERFPDAALVDVPGLVKLVDHAEIEQNDWSLTPGRYVGIAPEEVDDNFDFEEAIREIHVELNGLNEEAVELAMTIAKNFTGLGI